MIAGCGALMLYIGFLLLVVGTMLDSLTSLTTETAKVVKCIQAFLILGNMFSLPALILATAISAYRDRKCIVHRRNKIGTVAAILCFFSGVFTLIGVVVYAAVFQDYTHILSIPFKFCVAGLVFNIVGGFLIGLFVKRNVPDSQSVVSSSRQTLSLPPTVTGNLSTEMVPLSHQRQRQQQQAVEQQEQDRKRIQLLLHQLQQQQLLHERQRLQQLKNQLRLRGQQLGPRGEQLQQQQERQQQQQQMQHQLQTRRQDCQEGQNNNTCRSSSQPQIFTLSPPSYESLQPAPYSGAAPTQSPQPSYEPQTTSVEPLPPSYEPQTISVEPLPPPYESILPQPAETLPPSYESIQQYE